MQETIGTFELIISGSILIFIISGLFVIFYYHFSRKIILAKLQQSQLTLEHQKDLLRTEIAIIENERKRIARDLHDEIGANLAYIGINLTQLLKECPNEIPSFNNKISLCQSQLNGVITDVRRISHDLLPPVLEMFGLIPSVQEFIDNLKSSFEIDFTYDETFNQIDPDIALQLYRILLELISNSIKHSGGNKMAIRMTVSGQKRKIEIEDNGVGCDFNTMKKTRGLGLKNIIGRLGLINANYVYTGAPGRGFFMEIELN